LDEVSIDLEERGGLQKQVVAELEKLLARDIQGNMRRVLTKTQNFNSDIVGLGQYVRSQQSKWFKDKDWAQEFANSDIEVEVKVLVKRIGNLINPTY